MSLTERIREKAYWCLDAMKGSAVRKHYEEVHVAYEYGVTDSSVQEKIDRLLRFAAETVPYYASFKNKKDLKLGDFPLMNKMNYISNYEQVQSERYKNDKGNITVKTSGSTGIPFQVIYNKDKWNRNTAVSLVLNEKGGYRLGDKWVSSRIWANTNKKSDLQKMMENIITVDASVLNEEWFQEIYDAIVKKHAKTLTMYPASIPIFMDFVEKKHLDVSHTGLRGVFTVSEAPNQEYREKLSKMLKCPVNAFYSNTENGNMSLQDGTEDYRLDNSTWFYEILKFDSDEPAEEGEVGRIVITDLYNYAMPMIRYDNGDVGALRKVKVEGTDCYKVWLTDVMGRRVDMVYDVNGTPVSYNVLTVKMRGFPNLVQWQFIQHDETHYEFLLNSNGKIDEEEIKKRYRTICGENIKFTYVDEIPVMASGKRKLVENRMKQK